MWHSRYVLNFLLIVQLHYKCSHRTFPGEDPPIPFSLPVFQSEDVKIHLLFPEMERLLKKTLACVLPVATVRAASDDLAKMKVDTSPQLDDDDLSVGVQCRDLIEAQLEEGDLAPAEVNTFFRWAPS